MKIVHRLLGILIAFCLMWILFITSIQAVVYWNPGYFEKEYTKYQVLDDLPPMTMEDLLDVTDEMMDYLKGDRADLHVTTTMGRGDPRVLQRPRNRAYGGRARPVPRSDFPAPRVPCRCRCLPGASVRA